MIDRTRSRHVRAMLPEIILSEINAHEHLHGYALISIIRKKLGIYIGPSTIYPLLYHLEQIKMLSGRWLIEGPHQRPIKEYTLTALGRSEMSNSARDLKFIVQPLIPSLRTEA